MSFQVGKTTAGASGSKAPQDAIGDLDSFAFDDSERDWLDPAVEGHAPQEKLVDADFFNQFEDDFDEDDIAMPQ